MTPLTAETSTVTFIGGPRDGQTKEMVVSGDSVLFTERIREPLKTHPTSRAYVTHQYEWARISPEEKSATATYLGVFKGCCKAHLDKYRRSHA